MQQKRELSMKKERGSNRMAEPNCLIREYIFNISKYLNVSIDNRAWVAEWLTQSLDTRCPSGYAGSIPVPGAISLCLRSRKNLFNGYRK